MSSIGPSGFGYLGQVSAYAGSLRSNADSDAARSTAAQRVVDAEHRALTTAELHEPSETDRAADRDSEGFYSFDDAKHGSADDSPSPTDADARDGKKGRITRRSNVGHDDHRGNLIDVQI